MRRATRRPKPIHDRILQALCDHPFLSRRQLELYLRCSDGWARKGLARLVKRGSLHRYNAHQPWMHTRALFAPTAAGIAHAARQKGMTTVEFVRQKGLHLTRLERLAVTMERGFQLRTVLLWLARPSPKNAGWRAVAWDVEVGRFFSTRKDAFWIPFHGAALLQRTLAGPPQETRWIPAVVELDLRRVAVEKDRARWVQFVLAQDDARFLKKEKELHFPVLLIIAQDQFRLQDYYALLRAIALSRQLPMPRVYLTTFAEMLTLRDDNTRPIWYSTISGRRVPLLFDLEGIPGPLPDQLPWTKMPLPALGGKSNGVITPEFSNQLDPNEANERRQLARLAFALSPMEKRVLDEIAAHPLLKEEELAMLLQATPRRVRPALARLMRLNLIEEPKEQYLITSRGEHYLAMVAGFGNAVRRYAYARGWGRGFDTLTKHWEHTRAENEFFLHLAAIAQANGHTLFWLSELESRLYYEAGNRQHSFMPDGRGSYIAGHWRYEFALEIDRSRVSQAKLHRKFAEYAACVNSNVLRSEGIELLRVLVVTNSWERAETLRQIARQSSAGVPIFITTADRYRASGADAAIWLRVDEPVEDSAAETPKVHCFECFRPKRNSRK